MMLPGLVPGVLVNPPIVFWNPAVMLMPMPLLLPNVVFASLAEPSAVRPMMLPVIRLPYESVLMLPFALMPEDRKGAFSKSGADEAGVVPLSRNRSTTHALSPDPYGAVWLPPVPLLQRIV